MGDRRAVSRSEIMLVEHLPAGPAQVDCVVRLGRGDDLGPVGWRARHPVDPAAVERELRSMADAREAAVRRAGGDGAVAHGQLLFDLLLPAPLKRAIRARPGGALLIRGRPDIPWPVLHDGRGFLGRRFDLGEGRWTARWSGRADAPSDRLLILCDPAADLPAARAEGDALSAVLGRVAAPPPYDMRLGRMGCADILRALRRYGVLHFAGHVDPPDAGDGWRLADGHLDPAAIDLLRGGPVPRLVFANACRSLGSTGRALLDAGVRHLIGTDLDLPDLQGADFARDVHRALFEGQPVGAALRLARRRAAERDDPAWMAYRLVGDPRTRYAEPRPEAQAELRRVVALAVRRPLPDDPEARAAAFHDWRRDLDARLAPLGGRLLPASGQICRVVFGLPTRRADDPRRVAEAALTLLETTPEAAVAVETGRIAVAGDDLLGGPLDVTEALCWRHPSGAWLGEGAARALRGIARLDPDGRLAGVEPRPRAEGPFIGRGEELDRVARMARRVAEGAGETLAVIGPAGIGKSRLLDAVEARLSAADPGDPARADRFRIVRVEGDGAGPFGGIERLTRRLCGLEPDADPATARRRIADALDRRPAGEFLSIDDLLGDGSGPASADGETRRRHAETLTAMLGYGAGDPLDGRPVAPAVRALIEASADAGPLALLVEDVHDAPDPAQAVLEALIDDPPPMLLAVTARPGAPLAERPGGATHHRLELPPLPAAAARALVTALRPDADGPAVDAVLDRAEGNPLFIHELARRAGGHALPETIEALMQARLDRLPPADRATLRAAAILGRTFWQAGVARLVGRPSVEADLDRLAAARFVAREPRSALPDQSQWRFEHGLLHAAVLRTLPRQTRAALHGRAALWLADELPPPLGPRADRIARHREAAGDPARAVHDWLSAADHAEATLAPDAARRALEAALSAHDRVADPPPHRRTDLLARLADLDRRRGALDQAAARFTDALAGTPPGPTRARRLARLAAVELARGRIGPARAAIDAAVALVDAAADVEPSTRSIVAYQAAWTDYHQGDLDGARRRLEALLDRLPPDADRGRGMAWRLLGTIAQQRGDAEAAAVWLRRALNVLKDDEERVRALHGLALVAVQRGEYDDAAAHYARTVRIRARLGDRAGLARTYSNLGTLCGERGDFARAERYLREAIRIRKQLNHGSLAISHANLVELYLRQGRSDAARAELDRVTALLDAGRAPAWARSELWRITADVRLRHGELDAAEADAARAIAVARDMADPLREASALEVRARIAAARGHTAAAAEAFEQAVDIYEEHESTGALALVLDQLADLIEPDDPTRAARLRRQRAQIRGPDG